MNVNKLSMANNDIQRKFEGNTLEPDINDKTKIIIVQKCQKRLYTMYFNFLFSKQHYYVFIIPSMMR